MLRTIVLICAASTSPADCTPTTALDVLAFPPERAAICGAASQETVARMALRPDPGVSYAKTVCERVREAAR